jgi:hypothetical protein
VTGMSSDLCLALPAMAALTDGFDSCAVIDASGEFSRTRVERTRALRTHTPQRILRGRMLGLTLTGGGGIIPP